MNVVAASAQQGIIAAGCDDGIVYLWNATSGAGLHSLTGHASFIVSLDFNASGSHLASGGDDHTARIWDTATGTAVSVMNGHASHVYSVRFSPDGSTIATGSLDCTAKVWDTSGSMLFSLSHSGAVNGVCYHPSGAQIATCCGDGRGRMFDATTGALLWEIKGGAGELYSLCISFDGNTLATGGEDATVTIDVRSGLIKATLTGHTSAVTLVRYLDNDGEAMLSGSVDEVLLLYVDGKEVNQWGGCTHGSREGACLF